MAEKAGVSPTTYYKGKTVLEEASEEVKEKVKSNDMSISEAYKTVRQPRGNRKPKEATDFIMLPASCFDETVRAIEAAREKGESKIKLIHNGHEIVSSEVIVAT